MTTIIQADAVEEGMELPFKGSSVIVEDVTVRGIRTEVLTTCGLKLVCRSNARVQVLS